MFDLLLALRLVLPDSTAPRPVDEKVPPPTATTATAARASATPVLDGRDDDPIWVSTPPITQFRQREPREDTAPSLRTEARIAYDDRNLYVLVRAFDPHPDSIVSLLSRRDAMNASDRFRLLIDSYHDRKSGFEFSVTPSGVKTDATIINDMQEDNAWDGVWDVATRIDSLGWVAEFRIPFAQLRFPDARELTFGLAILRDVGRSGERISWPVVRRSKPGISSQLGELRGLVGVASPIRLEVLPYSVVRSRSQPAAAGRFTRAQDLTGGVDLKLGLGAGLRLDATVNPDFGQVEADPSVLNLTVFEQIFEERRPFFLEGSGLFRYDITCGGPACNGLFYSRRIGRAPQLSGLYGDATSPGTTNILGATKLTGRTSGGLSVGLLASVTAREAAGDDRTLEPLTKYGILRLQQDWRRGLSNAGLMLTSTQRDLDRWSRDYLRSGSTVLGFDTRHRLFGNNYMARSYAAVSHVAGSSAAITRTKRASAHYYQRPDDGLDLDSAATSLTGAVIAASVAKQGGGILRWSTAYRYTSAGFEPNDAGFLQRADYQAWQNTLGLAWNRPSRLARQATLTLMAYGQWNSSGQSLGQQLVAQANLQLPSQWWLHASVIADGVGANAMDDRLTRGGPAVQRDARTYLQAGITSDQRRKVAPSLFARGMLTDANGSWSWGFDPMLAVRSAGRFQSRAGLSYLRSREGQQWAGAFPGTSGAPRYTFATLDQHMVSFVSRLDFAASPTWSLQVYASPFVATGHHAGWKELVDPRASRTANRMRPFTERGEPSRMDFNVKEFRSNTVLRWEYRPGSTLYFVWSQGRNQGAIDAGSFDVGRDLGNLFRTRADNSFIIKVSYWFNPSW